VAADMRRMTGTAAATSTTDAGVLYERYSGRILAYCLHALRDRGEAEDAVQTTFLQAHRALARGTTPEHEFAWLHTIAKNVCRVQRRTAARRAVVTGIDLDTFPAGGGGADEREHLRGLSEALASMPETQRRALLMHEWHGLSSAEVASRMGMSAPATYALLTRARRSLADALTTVKGRSALGLNVWPLLLRLKGLVAGGTAKVATTTAVVVAVAASGVTIQSALEDRSGHPTLV
jgi:RNA polymerase sigma-70 factor, ECF subfamily